MSRFSAGMGKAGRRRWFSRVGARVAAPIDKTLYRVSHHWLDAPLRRDIPTLMLTTTGRHTGKTRSSPLLYLEEGNGWAVVGTNWGRPHHPAWSHNLLADPRAVLGFGDHEARVTARRVRGPEFDRLWARFVEMWPAFEDYRRRCGRELRMFVFDASSANG